MDGSSFNTNQEIMIFTDKKIHSCSYSGPGISDISEKTEKGETKVIL